MFHRKDVTFSKSSVFQPGVEEYAERHSSPPPAETSYVQRRTYKECPEWANIVTSPLQLALLRMLASLTNARRVLEVGTFTGHATLGIASCLPADGTITTLDNFVADERARQIAKGAFDASPHGDRITLVEGDALDSLNEINGAFDLIFVDADKPNYINYYSAILDRNLLSANGLMVFDNTLWGGLVVNPPEQTDSDFDNVTLDGSEWLRRMQVDWGRHLIDFNTHVANDPRVEKVLLTVRDGMTLIRLLR